MFSEYPDVLNIKQLCSALDIGKNTAYKLINSGSIRSLKIGNVHKIPKNYIIDYIEQAI